VELSREGEIVSDLFRKVAVLCEPLRFLSHAIEMRSKRDGAFLLRAFIIFIRRLRLNLESVK